MSDLISRSALLTDIEQAVVFSGRLGCNDEVKGANKIIDRIACAPAIEDKPARWTGFSYFKCSNCGGEAPDDGWWRSPFCPHCGKPMENGVKTNEA